MPHNQDVPVEFSCVGKKGVFIHEQDDGSALSPYLDAGDDHSLRHLRNWRAECLGRRLCMQHKLSAGLNMMRVEDGRFDVQKVRTNDREQSELSGSLPVRFVIFPPNAATVVFLTILG